MGFRPYWYQVIQPADLREQEAHGGRFGAHLSDAKVHSELVAWNETRRHLLDAQMSGMCHPQHWEESQATPDADPCVWSFRQDGCRRDQIPSHLLWKAVCGGLF